MPHGYQTARRRAVDAAQSKRNYDPSMQITSWSVESHCIEFIMEDKTTIVVSGTDLSMDFDVC